jgi:hypothetical protein
MTFSLLEQLPEEPQASEVRSINQVWNPFPYNQLGIGHVQIVKIVILVAPEGTCIAA